MLVGVKFKNKALKDSKRLRRFLTKIENNPPIGLDKKVEIIADEVWKDIDCLACGNCCKKMTPTFLPNDLKRISKHLNLTINEFKEKYLTYDKKDDDWRNTSLPCQFLDKKDNKCSIYEVRPNDCAKFPHLTKKKTISYVHVHKQNIIYCPATYNMVLKMEEAFK